MFKLFFLNIVIWGVVICRAYVACLSILFTFDNLTRLPVCPNPNYVVLCI